MASTASSSACLSKLGAKGVEQVIQLELSAEEKAALNKSADAVREILTVMGI